MIVEVLARGDRPHLRFEVPGPPVPKGRPRFSPEHGRAFTPKRTRDYEKHVRTIAWAALNISGLAWPLLETTRYRVRLDFYMPTRRAVDADNLSKAVLDSVEPVLFGNDARVTELHATRAYDKSRPRVVVDVEVLP